MSKAIRFVVTLGCVCAFTLQAGAQFTAALAQSGGALTGQVSSAEEGTMEGVVVSARKDGASVTVSVVSDNQGRYNFPADRLEPGQYTLDIRAVGYVLDGLDSADVAAGSTASADLRLVPTKKSIRRKLPMPSGCSAFPARNGKRQRCSVAPAAIPMSAS